MEKSEFFKNARTDLKGPMDGVTVVEATTTWAGPMAGCVLADYGATVIKVEHPDGEISRRLPPFVPGSQHSVFDESVNRNKQNVSLNLQIPEGRDLFLRICESADIMIENFRPGTLRKWGLGYEHVVAVKPDIVYVSVSGFGQFGPIHDRVGYDPLAQNFCGWSSLNGDPDGGPMKAPTFLADDLGGLHGAMGAMAALRHRDQTGEGQHVDVCLVDSLLFQSDGNLTSGALGIPLEKWANQFAIAAPINAYPCTDGSVFAGVLLDTHWQALCHLIGDETLAHLTNMERIQHREQVDTFLAEWCAVRTTAEVVAEFERLGLPATRINTYEECAEEAHVAERDMLQPTTMADGNEIPMTGPAAKFSRTPARVRHAAPSLGQHNEEVYGAIGIDADALEDLKKRGVV